MKLFRGLVLISVLIITTLVGCDYMPFGYTPIGEVNLAPGRYEGQEVRVKGTVTHVSKLPFFQTKSYTLRDRSGEIMVLTGGTLPAIDETVAIRAKVKTEVILNNQSFGTRLKEIKKVM